MCITRCMQPQITCKLHFIAYRLNSSNCRQLYFNCRLQHSIWKLLHYTCRLYHSSCCSTLTFLWYFVTQETFWTSACFISACCFRAGVVTMLCMQLQLQHTDSKYQQTTLLVIFAPLFCDRGTCDISFPSSQQLIQYSKRSLVATKA